MALNNYEISQYLPEPLRIWLDTPNKVSAYRTYDYIRIFDGQDLMACLNNKFASDVASGYTPANHSNLMSGIAPRLQQILVNKVVNKVDFIGYKDCEAIEKVISKDYLSLKLKKSFNNAVRTGRDVLVLYHKEDELEKTKTLEIQNVECFRAKLTIIDEKINEAEILIRQNKIRESEYFNVFEHRFYGKDGKPYCEYTLTKMTWENSRYDKTNKQNYSKDEIELLKQTIDDEFIKNTKFYTPKELPFDDLGCYKVDNTLYNSKFPYTNIPESRFVNIQDKIVEIENSLTYKEIDKNIGRGRAVIPANFDFTKGFGMAGNSSNLANRGAFNNPMDSTYFVKYQTNDMSNAHPQAMQFDIRSTAWRESLNGEIGDLCAAFGLSVLDYDPRLLMTGQKTDDEINAMTDISAATVEELRSMNEYQINLMLNSIAKYLGYQTPVTIKWNVAAIINPNRNQDLITKMLANGTISRKKAIQRSNPDYTDEEVEEELKKIEEERGLDNPLF